ncbi:MAG: DUF481 domain-containing protein [Alphaproteobacteria bacterium]
MIRIAFIASVIGLAAFATVPVAANDWSGTVDLGASSSSGNSEVTTVTGTTKLVRDGQNWRNTIKGDLAYAEDQGIRSTERYAASFKTDLKLDSSWFLFAIADGALDEFGGVRKRASGALGVGKGFFRTKAGSFLEAEIGAGMRYQEDQAGFDEDEAIGRFALTGEFVINDGIVFAQSINVEGGDTNIATISDSALRFDIMKGVFAKLGVNVHHNSGVPAGTEKTDTLTTFSVGYKFGK